MHHKCDVGATIYVLLTLFIVYCTAYYIKYYKF